MRYLMLALFLIGCGGSEEQAGSVSFAVTLNAGQSPSCSGDMALVLSQPQNGADTAITGSWSCGSYGGAVIGAWPAGSETMNLTLAPAIPATVRFGWTGLTGTARIDGADVPFVATP